MESADRLSILSQIVAFLPTPGKIFSQEFTLVGVKDRSEFEVGYYMLFFCCKMCEFPFKKTVLI